MSAFVPDLMNPAQRQAICQAWDILGEHFDGCLVVVDWELETDGKCEDAHEGYWHGGSMRAVGLAHFARQHIMESGKPMREPEEPGT
jgi:hypothetical protein